MVTFYKDLWHVEQAFGMSKSDQRTRPIFHRTQDAIKAHVLVCFMALMMGKYLEMKTGQSLRRVRDDLWKVHEAQVCDLRTGEMHMLRMDTGSCNSREIIELLESEFTHY